MARSEAKQVLGYAGDDTVFVSCCYSWCDLVGEEFVNLWIGTKCYAAWDNVRGAVPETKDLKSEVWVKSHQSASI